MRTRLLELLRKAVRTGRAQHLYFGDARSAWQYACRFDSRQVEAESVHLALVADEVEWEFSTTALLSDGGQRVTLNVAADDGGFAVVALTAGSNGPRLKPGDMVAWKARGRLSEMFILRSEPRMLRHGGEVIGTLKPVFRLNVGWRRGRRFSNRPRALAVVIVAAMWLVLAAQVLFYAAGIAAAIFIFGGMLISALRG